jgi:hypothetical protein
MIEFLVVASVLLLAVLSVAQLCFLYVGKGAVETAAHFASRAFARSARADFLKARSDTLRVASEGCSRRLGGSPSPLSQTVVQVERENGDGSPPRPGDAWIVRLTHAFELTVPVAAPVLYAVSPIPKVRIGNRFLLYLRSARVVTVE